MTILCIILALAAVAAAAWGSFQFSKARFAAAESQRLAQEIDSLRRKHDQAAAETAAAAAQIASWRERCNAYERETADLRKLIADNETNFTRISAVALNEQRQRFSESNEQRIKEILSPLASHLEAFKNRVEECYSSEARERFALRSAIGDLMSQTQSIGREARELVNALKGDSKAQGDWGEMILERLLENSGLQPGREFKVQMTRDAEGNVLRNDEGGALRPDVVVFLPDNRAVVIDSKVSLTAYTDWVNATDETARSVAARRHVESVKSHIAELRNKRYQDFIGSRNLDFVMMFMPGEGSYLAAMQMDESLWQHAFDNRVLIVSPTHLVSVLRLTAQLWAAERRDVNALQIAEEAGKLHDKIAAFADDMTAIRAALDRAAATWQSAMSKLSEGRGNILRRTDQLRELGAKASKRLKLSDKSEDQR